MSEFDREPGSPAGGSDRPSLALHAGLFLLSAALLCLEVLQTKIFAYTLDPLLVFGAISVALLGLGASGTALAVWRGWRRFSPGTVAAVAAACFAVGVVFVNVVFARISRSLAVPWFEHESKAFFTKGEGKAIAAFAFLALPYLGAGAAITAVLARAGKRVHALYFTNLLGSAAGCFAVVVALRPLGAEGLLAAVALAAAGSGLLFARSVPAPGVARRRRAGLVAGGAALVALLAALAPRASFPLASDPTGQLWFLESHARSAGKEARREWSAWDPVGRVEIHEFPGFFAEIPDPVPFRFYAHDGGAGSVLLGLGGEWDRGRAFTGMTLYAAAYEALAGAGASRGDGHAPGDGGGSSADGPAVLVIGVGGAPDLVVALAKGARRVVGVEINGGTIEALSGPYAEFLGLPPDPDRLELVEMDGRTFARTTTEAFDLVQMSGADTKSVLATGSLALSENHLYTVEAFGDYLDRLRPGGVFSVLRFGANDRLRLCAIAVEALRRRGVARPERHVMALEQGVWTAVLVSPAPFDREAEERVRGWVARAGGGDTGVRIPPFDVMGFDLSPPPILIYPLAEEAARLAEGAPRRHEQGELRQTARFFEAVARGEERAFLEALPVNATPTTDDRPFFFDSQRADRLLSDPQPHYMRLGRFLFAMTVAALLAVLGPLVFLGRVAGATRGAGRALLYFGALGVAFMVVEISLIQKLSLLLGHQTYSITVVLATLLASAGVGSALAGRLVGGKPARLVRFAVLGILVVGIGETLLLDAISSAAATLPLAGRIAIAAVLLAPLGLFMGMPFPTGLRALEGIAPPLVPWAIGLNGFASVVGSAAALPACMLAGYRAILAAGFAAYAVAALAVPRGAGER